MICQSQDGAFAMIGVAIMIAVDEVRSEFAQIVWPDWPTAQRTDGLPTGHPAIHQYEPHVAPPGVKQNSVSLLRNPGVRKFVMRCSVGPFSGRGLKWTEPAAVAVPAELEAISALF
jgi:hypothetical protein